MDKKFIIVQSSQTWDKYIGTLHSNAAIDIFGTIKPVNIGPTHKTWIFLKIRGVLWDVNVLWEMECFNDIVLKNFSPFNYSISCKSEVFLKSGSNAALRHFWQPNTREKCNRILRQKYQISDLSFSCSASLKMCRFFQIIGLKQC